MKVDPGYFGPDSMMWKVNKEITVLFGGGIGGSPYKSNHTETYNGTNWSEVNDMIAGIRQGAGGGTTESFIVFGGTQFPATPYYNPTE